MAPAEGPPLLSGEVSVHLSRLRYYYGSISLAKSFPEQFEIQSL